MSGAMSSPLGAAILQGVSQANGGGMPGPQQGPQPGMAAPGMAMPQPGVQTPIPLSSMLANNATALQLQNPTQPWYNVPGMFKQPPPNPATSMAPPAAPATSGPPVDYTTFLNPDQQSWLSMMTTGTPGQQGLAKQAYQVNQYAQGRLGSDTS